MVRLAVNWWWLVGLSCSIGACRAHEALCQGVDCDEAPQSGAGGAPPSTPENVAGEGGAGAGAGAGADGQACQSDQHCQNDSSCDGEERCTATGCEPGTKVDCDHGTKCDDAAPEQCVYAEPSPWLLATSAGALVALPTAQLGSTAAFTIAPKPGQSLFEGYSRIFWAPDGKVAIVQAEDEDFGHSFHYARFGAGLPSALTPLPEVPNYTEGGSEPEFSADSAYAFVYDSNSGTYLLNLQNPSVPTRHIPPVDGAVVDTIFCADQRSWFAWASPENESLDRAWIARLEGDALEEQSIGELDGFEISSDRRLLVLDHGDDDDGNDLGFVLRPCSTDAWSVEFPEGRYHAFSPDSKLLWLEDGEGVQKVLSLEDPSSPVELLSSEGLAAQLLGEFTPDSKRLRASIDGEPQLVELSQAASQPLVPLGLPDTASIAVLRNAALLAWSDPQATPDQLVWQAMPPEGEPVALLQNITAESSRFIDDTLNPERVFLVRELVDASELYSIWLDGSAPDAKLLTTIDGTFDGLNATPDQAGMVFARSGAFGGTLMFARFERSGALGIPRLVSEGVSDHGFQPWH